MQPEISINYLAVAVCTIVAMPVGFLWFGPLFGKAWAKAMGLDLQEGAPQAKSLVLYALGSFLIALVLAHGLEVWRPSNWGAGADEASWVYAVNGAGWTWLGFFVPLQLGRVAWEQRGWNLVAINSSFDLCRLLLFAFILAHWR